MTSDADPAPVPARVLLPAPDTLYEGGAWWELTTGHRAFALSGRVHGLPTRNLNDIEHDALAVLAAVHWARGAL